MQRVKMAIQEKIPNRQYEVLLLYDKARPHIANMTMEAIQRRGWEVLPHPPYSPDWELSDFHLFRSLSNAMHGMSTNTDAELIAWLDEFHESKLGDINQIENLARWEEIENNNGE